MNGPDTARCARFECDGCEFMNRCSGWRGMNSAQARWFREQEKATTDASAVPAPQPTPRTSVLGLELEQLANQVVDAVRARCVYALGHTEFELRVAVMAALADAWSRGYDAGVRTVGRIGTGELREQLVAQAGAVTR